MPPLSTGPSGRRGSRPAVPAGRGSPPERSPPAARQSPWLLGRQLPHQPPSHLLVLAGSPHRAAVSLMLESPAEAGDLDHSPCPVGFRAVLGDRRRTVRSK